MTCLEVLRRKYLGQGGFFQSSPQRGFQFWKGLHECNKVLERLVMKEVHNGENTYFWTDIWCGQAAMKTLFPNLFEVSYHKMLLWEICMMKGTGSWSLEEIWIIMGIS